MKIGAHGLGIIKHYESCKLEAYLCPAGVWTIGWGHTNGVKEGDVCSQEQADEWLAEDCYSAERAVNLFVKRPLTQNQFDALVSFTFNVGVGAFRDSTLAKMLNLGDFKGAAEQFGRWTKSGGKELKGLVSRREDEKHLFLLPTVH